MLFNSLQFLIFFPIVVLLYFRIQAKNRWLLLLLASYYFYMCWKPEYAVLIAGSTAVDYFVGLRMAQIADKRKRRPYLALSLTTNLGLLFAFKYFNFFTDSLRAVFDRFDVFYDAPVFNVLLPIGISFYTFQSLGYSLDVYRGSIAPERHFGRFALYVCFFPQLVAGPIERASHLLPQFYRDYDVDYARISSGVQQIIWGLFKKVVVADRLAIYVESVYSSPQAFEGIPILVASYFFAFQIYCDFSGYSDIAIGTARILGFDLMKNFRRPYLAHSIAEFWHRWHISLSTWFRDYLYIPMGGNRVRRTHHYANLFSVFLLSGLWHGANWTFLAWGAIHGAYLVSGLVLVPLRERLERWIPFARTSWPRRAIAIFTTFHLTLLAWVFFRADSISDAMILIQQGFSGLGTQLSAMDIRSIYQASVIAVGIPKMEFILSILAVAFVIAADLFAEWGPATNTRDRRARIMRFAGYDLLVLMIILFGAYGQQQFIYFQF
jgi:D-alanyl-lipoteichoic acid acyltransferase DltB (MBOAT superfamily)